MKVYKVDHIPLEDLLVQKSNIFQIPPYQRRFSWEIKHLCDLWNDVNTLKKDDKHFLGAIVVITHPHSPTGTNPLEIVDGQQRLTAVSILLCVIRDYFKENDKDKIAQTINQDFLNILTMEREIIGPKLELGNLDFSDYKKIMKSNLDDIENTRIFDAYEFFMEQIEELDDISKVKEFYNKLLKNIICVIISVDEDSDAYRLFETLNIRGLSLSPIDLIKNYLFRICNEMGDKNLMEVKEIWGKIITNLEQKNVDEIRFFRQYIMSSKKPETSEKITEKRLYKKFQQIINSNEIDVLKYIRDIRQHSELYKKICQCNIDLFDTRYNNEINLHLQYLSDIRAVTSYTLLLRVFKDLDNSKDILKIIELIETFAIRRIICKRQTGELDTFYNHLAINAFKQDAPIKYIKNYLMERLPDDEEFKKSFTGNDFDNNSQTRYILNKLEEQAYSKGRYPSKIINRFGVHIEHIMSRKLQKKEYESWIDYLGIDDDTHDKYVNRIGNLTLLEESLNIGASNKPFIGKKKHYSPKETEFAMTHDLLNYRRWSVNQIKKRSIELADKALNIWKF